MFRVCFREPAVLGRRLINSPALRLLFSSKCMCVHSPHLGSHDRGTSLVLPSWQERGARASAAEFFCLLAPRLPLFRTRPLPWTWLCSSGFLSDTRELILLLPPPAINTLQKPPLIPEVYLQKNSIWIYKKVTESL